MLKRVVSIIVSIGSAITLLFVAIALMLAVALDRSATHDKIKKKLNGKL